MKALSTVLVIVLAWTSIQSTVAKDSGLLETKVTITQIEHGKYQLTYRSQQEESLHIQILDDKNNELYQEIIRNHHGFKKPFDISNLPYGEYKFRVRVNGEKVVHEIVHEAPRFPGNVKVLIKPGEQNDYVYRVVGPDAKDFKLRIFDDHNRLLLEEKIQTKENFGKVYKMDEVRSKSVTFVLSKETEIIQTKTFNL